MATARQFINCIYVILWHARKLVNLTFLEIQTWSNLIVLSILSCLRCLDAEVVLVLAAGGLNPDGVTGTSWFRQTSGHFGPELSLERISHHDRVVALRTGGQQSDRRFDKFLDPADIFHGLGR
jgi:hypothetical protein